MILTKYKNNLLKTIKESSLDPNLFITEEKELCNNNYFAICLRNSTILFAVCPWGDSFETFQCCYSQFRYGFPISLVQYAGGWDDLAVRFGEWLDTVVKPYLDDISTPNLWQILEKDHSRTKSELGIPEDFEPFSDEEKIQIRLSIKDFRLLIVNKFNPSKEELESIDARLKYLSDAIDKHNKFDWKGIAISTAISITVALSMNPEQANQLFQLFKEVFSKVLYLLS